MVPSPADADQVLAAIRLGWYLAEVRGRNRPRPPPGASAHLPEHNEHELPLRIERSKTELRIEAQAVVAALAVKLGVDATKEKGSYGETVDAQAKALARVRADPNADNNSAWLTLAATLWKFDAHIQDTLTATSDTQACGYQLGRGLSESYWALDPDGTPDPQTPASWSFLLGKDRRDELTKQLGRLSAYMNTYAPSAVAGTIEVWGVIAGDENWRRPGNAASFLHRQTRRWYELVILGQDPTTLIEPYEVFRSWSGLKRTVRQFWPHLVVSLGAASALFALVLSLGQGSKTSAGKTILATLAVTGFSVAGLTAKLKNRAQAVLTRLRQDAYTELIAVAITCYPEVPFKTRGVRTQKTYVQKAVRSRALTSATAN